jgi:ABC-2 type transport system permease protein
MTAGARAATRVQPARPGLGSRLLGLGSVFGKTLRDSRRAVLLTGGVAGLLMLATAAALVAEFPDRQDRLTLVAQMALLPVAVRGLLGEPIAIDTLGGFMSWRVGNSLPAILGIWSVLALSGTLAGEAARGSLDLLVAMPRSRWRIGLEKLLAHVVAVALAMLIAAVLTSATGLLGTLPGDEVPLSAALAQFALTGLLMLVPGAIAFAAGPVVGRGRAAGLGFVVLFAGYLVPSYAETSPVMAALEPLSPFAWTAGHRPLAGRYDWPPVGLLALLVVAFGVAGLVAFERRDIGRTLALRWLRIPGLPAGTGGPFTRELSQAAGTAIGWGLGIGAFGALIAASADAFTEAIGGLPQMRELVAAAYPGVDITQPSGVLQLAFFSFGSVLAGLAAASFVASWASDETSRRLDLVLSTPVSRVGWAVRAGLGVLGGIVITVAVAALLIGPAIAGQGGDVARPLLGLGVLGLYAAAVAGVGLAVGGLVRADLATPAAGALVIGSYLLELIGSILRFPDWLIGLSLNHHFGQPMAGTFDPFGLAVMALLAVGGLALGALGLQRRDVQG